MQILSRVAQSTLNMTTVDSFMSLIRCPCVWSSTSTLHMVMKTPTRPLDFNRSSHFIELLLSTSWRIRRVVNFNKLQVVDFNRLRLSMPILLTTLAAAPELNNLQCVEISNSMNAPTCGNQQLDECDDLLKSTGPVRVLITM